MANEIKTLLELYVEVQPTNPELPAGGEIQIACVDTGGGRRLVVVDEFGNDLLGTPEISGQSFTGGLGAFHEDIRYSVASEIQYVQVLLTAGKTINSLRTIQVRGSTGSFRLGVYDQADPYDKSLGPLNKVGETLPVAQSISDHVVPLVVAFVVPATGYYWLAFLADSNGGGHRWVGTEEIHQALVWLRYEAGIGVTLPVSATPLTPNSESPVPFLSAVE